MNIAEIPWRVELSFKVFCRRNTVTVPKMSNIQTFFCSHEFTSLAQMVEEEEEGESEALKQKKKIIWIHLKKVIYQIKNQIYHIEYQILCNFKVNKKAQIPGFCY